MVTKEKHGVVHTQWQLLLVYNMRTLIKLLDNLAPNKVYIGEITRHVIVVDTRDCQTIDNQSLKWEDMYSTKHKNKLVRSFVEIKNPKFDPMHDNMDFRFTEQLAAQG